MVPVRALAIDRRAPGTAETADVDTWAALALAETLGIPLVTKHAEIGSKKIPSCTPEDRIPGRQDRAPTAAPDDLGYATWLRR